MSHSKLNNINNNNPVENYFTTTVVVWEFKTWFSYKSSCCEPVVDLLWYNDRRPVDNTLDLLSCCCEIVVVILVLL